jgi:hypothetical protein
MRARASLACGATTALLLTLLPSTALAQTVEFTSLRIMRDKGILTQAEYDAALADLQSTSGDRAAESTSLVVGKWSTTLYGFAEADFIHDTTQSFNDSAGNAQVARPNASALVPVTYAGDNGRTTFSVRNSRLGLRFRAPEYHRVSVSGMLETDFLGAQPAITTGSGEGAYFTSPVLRVRHAMARVETPVVDVLVGQYWDLFGWQGVYAPNAVEIQGLPGQLYSRDIQLRVSKTLKTDAVTFEIAAAAVRPPSRNSQVPDLQGGLRFAVNHWKGIMTAGATGTSVMPASIAVTGDSRHFQVPEFSQLPTQSVSKDVQSVAVDAFIPIIPQSSEKHGNALSLTGEFVYGNGISNLYTGLTGGMTFPTVPNTSSMSPAPTYPQDVDNGMVVYDTAGNLHAIQWTTFIVGLQYYLPAVQGKLWVSANYSRQVSADFHQSSISPTGACISGSCSATSDFTAPPGMVANPNNSTYVATVESVRHSLDWFDVNVFSQLTPAFRIGVEYANFNDFYTDGTHATNHRVQASGFLIF